MHPRQAAPIGLEAAGAVLNCAEGECEYELKCSMGEVTVNGRGRGSGAKQKGNYPYKLEAKSDLGSRVSSLATWESWHSTSPRLLLASSSSARTTVTAGTDYTLSVQKEGSLGDYRLRWTVKDGKLKVEDARPGGFQVPQLFHAQNHVPAVALQGKLLGHLGIMAFHIPFARSEGRGEGVSPHSPSW